MAEKKKITENLRKIYKKKSENMTNNWEKIYINMTEKTEKLSKLLLNSRRDWALKKIKC